MAQDLKWVVFPETLNYRYTHNLLVVGFQRKSYIEIAQFEFMTDLLEWLNNQTSYDPSALAIYEWDLCTMRYKVYTIRRIIPG